MKKTLLWMAALSLLSNSAIAELKVKEINEKNCLNIVGWVTTDPENIAKKLQVPVSSVSLIRTEWGRYSCIAVVDTAKGPRRLTVMKIISNGKELFAYLAEYGNLVPSLE